MEEIGRVRKWMIFLTVTVIGFVLDILTKHIAAKRLISGRPVDVIGEYFQLALVYNTGGVFGINPIGFLPGFPVNVFFYIFSALAIVFLIVYFIKLKTEKMRVCLGLSLIMPGALGNLFDRVVHPQMGVVDFIKIGISRDLYWPIFNFADIYITVGVLLIAIDIFTESRTSVSNIEKPSS